MDVTAYELISHLCCLHNQRKMNKLNLEMLFALFYWFCGRTKKKKKMIAQQIAHLRRINRFVIMCH